MRTSSSCGYAVGAAMLLLASVLACGPVESPSERPSRGAHAQELVSDNGLSLNGLSLNGLSLNGLSLNGLSLNGLSSSAFASWLQEDPVRHGQVMRYLVRCAVPAGERRGHTHAATGATFTWEGGLGLAPDWSSGMPASVREQQLVSACLGAHLNAYGAQALLSVVGKDARGKGIYSEEELRQFPHREACFFGNLFTSEGLYAANDVDSQDARLSTPRGCVLACDNPVSRPGCWPLVNLPQCQSYCTLDESRTHYAFCDYGGVRYAPVTTRLRGEDVHRCGDGLCQPTESCGDGSTYGRCEVDCGRCADSDSEED